MSSGFAEKYRIFWSADEGIFPRANQSPTGALAAHCGAPPCSNPLPRKTKEKAPSLSLELFFGASSDTAFFENHRSTICF
ncbi:hypothetical protein [uncultured Gemmiger sp.]|uniref:hypothetical protein n=1 Tax=uncultured Gemmiger sp. TaxID=1623490 RepID=UPI0025DE2435|nr:hypothetical protein [uncultured Gemmiger sp.]